ncbi:MAG: type II secretion system F family protein [Phycisphaerales bacterium]
MSPRTFNYVAVDEGGQRVQGSIAASDRQDAFQRLARSGKTPVRVRAAVDWRFRAFGRRVSKAEIAAMTRELAVLVQARIPLSDGLAVMAQTERNSALAELLIELAGSIESGSRISDAVERHREVFGEAYVGTMRAAENSGMLVEITTHLAEMLDAEVALRQRLRRAAIYPAIVLTVVFAALLVIVGFVVPRFAATFAASGVALPLATRVVQAVGISLREWWWIYLGTAVVLVTAVVQIWQVPKGRLSLERIASRAPFIGRFLAAVETSRFCRVLAISSESGMGLIESVELGAEASGSHLVREQTRELACKLRSGAALSDALHVCDGLPPFARRLLAACKDSRDISHASNVIADHFDRESKHLAESVSSIIEPVMTIVLAFIVLVVALSVFLPMWQLVGLNR